AADVRLVGFHEAPQGPVLTHLRPDEVAHPKGRRVADPKLTLDLLGADPRPRLAHLPDAVEPVRERHLGIVEDRPHRGVDVATAVLAGVALPLGSKVMLRHPLALLAPDAVGPTEPLQVRKALP